MKTVQNITEAQNRITEIEAAFRQITGGDINDVAYSHGEKTPGWLTEAQEKQAQGLLDEYYGVVNSMDVFRLTDVPGNLDRYRDALQPK